MTRDRYYLHTIVVKPKPKDDWKEHCQFEIREQAGREKQQHDRSVAGGIFNEAEANIMLDALNHRRRRRKPKRKAK